MGESTATASGGAMQVSGGSVSGVGALGIMRGDGSMPTEPS